MVLSLIEIIDIVLMSLIVGYILKDIFQFKRKRTAYEPLDEYRKPKRGLKGLWFSILVTAPAIILHEFGHKYVAMGFGMTAVFKAAYTWLGIGAILKLLNTGIIFFVPAFVQITGGLNDVAPWQFSIVAFAGPAVNLVIWLVTAYIYKNYDIDKKYMPALVITSKINMLLYIFNMLPIPGFDGWKVYSGIFQTFF
jgi:Zn-dependent protease